MVQYLIKLRISATSFKPVHAWRAKYNRLLNAQYVKGPDFGLVGIINNIMVTPKNRTLLEKVLSNTSARQADFDMLARHAFRNRATLLKTVYLGLHSPVYLKLHQDLEHDLGGCLGWEYVNFPRDRGDKLAIKPRKYNDGGFPDPRPRVIIVSRCEEEVADQFVADMNANHIRDMGHFVAEGLSLYTRERTGGPTLIKHFPFQSESLEGGNLDLSKPKL